MQSLSSNGVAHKAIRGHVAFPVSAGSIDGGREPLDAVLEMGRNASRIAFVAILCAAVLHGAAITRAALIPLDFMHWSQLVGRAVHERLTSTYEVDIVKPPELPPLPPPPVEEPKPEPKEPPPIAVKETVPAAAPAAAKAGAVLTAPPDPNEPVNFDGIISGSGETFAGGNTMANGTSDTAVRVKPAVSGGVPGGTGTAATGPRDVDKSRVAKLSGSSDWHCPFPPEADVEQIDQAFVIVQVAARADGTPEHVTVLNDPGHGFGRAAQRCAMQERYEPAFDHDGNAIAGLTKSIRVRFER
jgi:periplasmic protein TonB